MTRPARTPGAARPHHARKAAAFVFALVALWAGGCSGTATGGAESASSSTASGQPWQTPDSVTFCVAAADTADVALAHTYVEALTAHRDRVEAGVPLTVSSLQQGATADEALTAALNAGCTTIATLSPSMAAPALEAARTHAEVLFEVAGVKPGTSVPRNVVPLNLGFDSTAFLAGYAAAGTTRSGVLGAVTASTGDAAIAESFAEGVDFYNQAHGTGVVVQGWDSTAKQANAVATANELTSQVATYLGQGADTILVAADGYSSAALAALTDDHADAALIFVGQDGYETIEGAKGKTLTSLLPDPDPVAEPMLEVATRGPAADIGYSTRLNSSHLADFREYTQRMPDKLRAELDSLATQISNGELTVGDEK